MKVLEYLEFFAAAYRIKGPGRRAKCEEVLGLVELGYKRDALVTSLSRGMTQRLGLARVLLHEPQVLLLDEPASGLDPRARIDMYELLKELRSMGKTILVSSHILPELAKVCNKIGIIERGELLFDGDVQTAIRQVQQHTVLQVAVERGGAARARGLLEGHPDVKAVELNEETEVFRVTLRDGVGDGSALASALVGAGLALRMLKEEEVNLEHVFMGITKGITN
jgi:ABC-2 type transport system ATP-binding protein